MKRICPKQRPTLYVDFSRGAIKMCVVEFGGDHVRFFGITRITLPRGEEGEAVLEGPEVTQLIRDEVKKHGWAGMRTACLLSRSATSTQSFLLPPMSAAELRQAIELKLADTLHFSIDEASFDFRKIHHGGDGEVMALVAAARNDSIHRAIEVLREAGLEPVAIGAAAEGLADLVYQINLCADDEAVIHVDIGSGSTILNLLEGRLLRFSREIDVAGETFTQALMRPIITRDGAIRLTHNQAEEVKTAIGYPLDDDEAADLPHDVLPGDILPLMEPVMQRLTAEINRSIDYLRGVLKMTRVDRIILSGPASWMRNLDVVLEENLGLPVRQADPVARAIEEGYLVIGDGDDSAPSGFSAILGYALGDHRPINLLPREEQVAQQIRRVARVRRMLVPPVAAAALALGLLSIPVVQTYRTATTLLANTAENLDRQTRAEESVVRRQTEVDRTVRQMRALRGAPPDWAAIMKELGAAMPDDMTIGSLRVRTGDKGMTLRLSATVRPGRAPFEAVVSQLTTKLDDSPFFDNIHVVDATAGGEGRDGRFEAVMEIVAGHDDRFGETAWAQK